ncbi:MAG: cytochrome P450 [Proteobacteria bacterium]|nr:cytochrome P450 [Pseudomonadota bacterium]
MRTKADRKAFPIGATIRAEALARDPYPWYAQLRSREPISWIEELGMWYVTRYEDVRTILMDDRRFTTVSENSLIFDTFGAQMLTSEGAEHERYRRPVQPYFGAGYIRKTFEAAIETNARELAVDFAAGEVIELRSAFAARLPVLTILNVFGMPREAEAHFRKWYDSFEAALANFIGAQEVRRAARTNVEQCHEYFAQIMREFAGRGERDSLLGALVNAPGNARLGDEEIRRNLLIIFFGGISTVEAVILNSLWALLTHADTLSRVRADPTLAAKVVEETMRWHSPVQSATRHVVETTVHGDIEFAAGDTVNCMLGSANRDETLFPDPDRFDIDRANVQRHLGFATGSHSCLGFNLAKAQARIALQVLLSELPGLELMPNAAAPEGYEFHQPRALQIRAPVLRCRR